MNTLDTQPALTAPPLPGACPTQAACKCCGSPARLAGFVDFARDCYGYNAKHGVVSGIPIPYYRCADCGFGFTDRFDDWTPEQFGAHIYNAEYHLYDPRFEIERPRKIANLVMQLFPQKEIAVLDYGSGNGKMAQMLREAGYARVDDYDPFHANPVKPDGTGYDLVTCIEVAEHTPRPLELFDELNRYASPMGVILFSTRDFSEVKGPWVNDWYVAPRNGHISFYDRQTMSLIAGRLGRRHLKIDSFRHLLVPVSLGAE